MIKKNLLTLKDIDLYSVSMFALYKLTGIQEYSAISELAYVLDKKNLLNLSKMFGGQTIRIPTTEELESIMRLLLLYHNIKIEKMEYDEAINLVGYASKDLRRVKKAYNELCKVLDNYEIKSRRKY